MQMISVDDCQLTILDGKKVCQNLMKSLLKIMMKIMIKDAYLKLMLNILKDFKIFTIIYIFNEKNEN